MHHPGATPAAMEAPTHIKAGWIAHCGVAPPGSGPFEPMDMDWFLSMQLVETHHQADRQASRDPFKALYRIRSARGKGLHALYGPPLIANSREGTVIIAAHDVCIVAAQDPDRRALVVVTTLPMQPKGPLTTFTKYVKFHAPAALARHRLALQGRQGALGRRRRKNRGYKLPKKMVDHFFNPI